MIMILVTFFILLFPSFLNREIAFFSIYFIPVIVGKRINHGPKTVLFEKQL